jgi:hypothetical protein
MTHRIIELEQFLVRGVFRQDDFLSGLEQHDFDQYTDTHVLVRGCDSAIIPPWAFMVLTARLVPLARTVRFGNEHDNVVIFRNSPQQSPK